MSAPGDAPAERPELTILMVNYRTARLACDSLASVMRETARTRYEIIVVDNASGDGSADAIAAAHPGVRLIALDENIGFGPANNVAGREARGEYILLLNPDTLIIDGAIDRLMDFALSRPEAGIWGGRTLYEDGALNPTSCFAHMTPWSVFCGFTGLSLAFPDSALFNPEAYGGWRREDEREVDIVCGCYLLIRRDLWRRLGGFDPDYFLFGEEVDLCLRARSLGARPAVTPSSTIKHFGGASTEGVAARRLVLAFQGKTTVIRKHWSRPARAIGLTLFWLWPLYRSVGFGVAGRLLSRRRWLDSAAAWGEVWRRRGEWIGGYPPSRRGAEAASS